VPFRTHPPPPWHDSPPVGQGLVIVEASRSYSDTPHSVGLLWTSDQPDAETSIWQHSYETNFYTLGGIGTRNPNKRAAANPRLRPRGQLDRQLVPIIVNCNQMCTERSLSWEAECRSTTDDIGLTCLGWSSCFIGPGYSTANECQNSRNQDNSLTVAIRPQPETRSSNSGIGKVVGSSEFSPALVPTGRAYYLQHNLYPDSAHTRSAYLLFSALLSPFQK
jgi:hypothetical protein